MKNIKLILLGLMIISIFSFSTISIAQETGSYKVKAGDSQTYKINKYKSEGKSEYQASYDWDDGTSGLVTIKAGVSFTMTICNITGTGTIADVYMKTKISGKTSTCEQSYSYVTPVADNSSYYQDFVDQNSTEYQLKGDIFTQKYSYSYRDQITYTEASFNIKTGWLTKVFYETKFTNGTVYSTIEMVSSGSGLPGFEVTSVLVFFGIVVPVIVLQKRKRNHD